MRFEEYARMHALEQGYWWFRAKRGFVSALLRRVGYCIPENGVVVDVGCGTGATLEDVGSGLLPVGVDDHAEALIFARSASHGRFVRGRATRLPLENRCADLVLLLDVAEHVPEDVRVFRELGRILKPTAVGVVHVPAHPALWSSHDEAMHHVRRYRRRELEERLHDAGLDPLVLTPTFAATLLPAAIVRWSERVRTDGDSSDFEVVPEWANHVLTLWHRAEARWIERRRLPFGLSLAAVVRRLDGRDE